jgi:hypothetical protein
MFNQDISDSLIRLHGLYGHDQELPDILDGLNTRLAAARQLYGPGRSIPMVVNGICAKLDRLSVHSKIVQVSPKTT